MAVPQTMSERTHAVAERSGGPAPGRPALWATLGDNVSVFALWRLGERPGAPSWLPRAMHTNALSPDECYTT